LIGFIGELFAGAHFPKEGGGGGHVAVQVITLIACNCYCKISRLPLGFPNTSGSSLSHAVKIAASSNKH
jgi:hypothetical protein